MLAVNPSACERLGYTHAELMTLTVRQVDSPAEVPHAPERIARLMEQGQLTFETVHQRKDGSSLCTEVSARRITWDGHPAIMSICRDLTERKQAEAALKERSLQLANLFNNAPVGIFHSTPEGRFLAVNPALAALLGYASPEELIAATTDLNTQI